MSSHYCKHNHQIGSKLLTGGTNAFPVFVAWDLQALNVASRMASSVICRLISDIPETRHPLRKEKTTKIQRVLPVTMVISGIEKCSKAGNVNVNTFKECQLILCEIVLNVQLSRVPLDLLPKIERWWEGEKGYAGTVAQLLATVSEKTQGPR